MYYLIAGGLMDIRTFFLEVLSKASHEKSADAIVPRCDLSREGQNFKKRVVIRIKG